MKKLAKVLMITILALSLVACGGNGGEDNNSEADENTLTVYSPHPAETINLVVDEFKNETGINVDVVAAGTGELLKRIESEKDNPLGDILWGGGAESLATYTEFFEPYESSELEAIDSKYYAEDNRWTGESPLPMVLFYNTELVDEADAPKGWEDILNPKFKGQIAMADPAKSGSAYTILATMVQAFGKDDGQGWEFIEDFYDALDGKVLSSSSSVYKGVADGEYAVGLTLEKAAIPYVLSGAPVEIVYPEEGTSAVPDGGAIISGAKNAENAKTFLDYVLSKEVQELMASEVSRRSVRSDATAPEGLGDLSEIKLIDYDFDWAANDKEEILQKWKDIMISN